MKKLMVLGISMLSVVAILAVGSPAAQADIVVAPALPVVGTLIHLVIHSPLSLDWI